MMVGLAMARESAGGPPVALRRRPDRFARRRQTGLLDGAPKLWDALGAHRGAGAASAHGRCIARPATDGRARGCQSHEVLVKKRCCARVPQKMSPRGPGRGLQWGRTNCRIPPLAGVASPHRQSKLSRQPMSQVDARKSPPSAALRPRQTKSRPPRGRARHPTG